MMKLRYARDVAALDTTHAQRHRPLIVGWTHLAVASNGSKFDYLDVVFTISSLNS